MQLILVSACLLGEAVRYNGLDRRSSHAVLVRWIEERRIVPICPEVAGGLPVPRPPAEIVGGAGGGAVLRGASTVVTDGGVDVTDAFRRGAEVALSTALARGVRVALLKEGSPSCGSGYIYDGTFSGSRRDGLGVTAALLQSAGIRVFSEHQFEDADRYLRSLGDAPAVVPAEDEPRRS
ncbi:MAG: DUF523 domain-containing protein [Candidatus Eisenbacteria bacterium]|nr:DUF523 domain-containing protein [Candidatus Eisenbacteria bacterium]